MDNIWNCNMSTSDRVIRFLVGCILILCVLFLYTKPVLALIAIYPVNTAIIKWDPFYALYYAVREYLQHLNFRRGRIFRVLLRLKMVR